MVGQLLLGLSILVGLHELGHLLTAKMFGMRVEKFSIGFPPKIAGFQWGETEYSIGAIPLGGFVKISGMVDESMDTAQMASEPQPWEFRSKPAWHARRSTVVVDCPLTTAKSLSPRPSGVSVGLAGIVRHIDPLSLSSVYYQVALTIRWSGWMTRRRK